MRKIDICLSPALFDYHQLDNQVIVVIDIIRMSSTVCSALHHGVKEIIPVADVETALKYKQEPDVLTAGERNSSKIDGFDLGNSPFEYSSWQAKNKRIVITTTNGTESIRTAAGHNMLIGCFMNETALADYLIHSDKNVLMLCSGWHKKPAIEDTLFAGSLATKLLQQTLFEKCSDTVNMAMQLRHEAQNHLFDYVMKHSYRLQTKLPELEKDFRFCLSPDIQTDIIPFMKDQKLIPLVR